MICIVVSRVGVFAVLMERICSKPDPVSTKKFHLFFKQAAFYAQAYENTR